MCLNFEIRIMVPTEIIQIYKFKLILKQVIWGGDFLAYLKGIVQKHRSALVEKKCYSDYGDNFPLLFSLPLKKG